MKDSRLTNLLMVYSGLMFVNIALKISMDQLVTLRLDEHAPLRGRSARGSTTPWIVDDLRSLMAQRNKAKVDAHKSGGFLDKSFNCNLRNKVTKLNYFKKERIF